MCGYECTSVDVFTLSNPTIVSYAMDLFVLILICTPLRQYVVVNDEYSCMCYILVSIHQYSYESNVYTVFVINGI